MRNVEEAEADLNIEKITLDGLVSFSVIKRRGLRASLCHWCLFLRAGDG